MVAPVQILQNRVSIDATCFEQLQSEFSDTGIALLPRFLSPTVRQMLMKQVAVANFQVCNEIGHRSGVVFGTTRKVPENDPAISALHFTLNRPELFDLSSKLCGIPAPGNFACRLHRTEASSAQHIDWHDDAVDERVLGLNINLGLDSFEGGLFQIRDPDKKVRRTIHFEESGDAFLFKIGGGWQHRLTPVEAGIRTVAVGWFRRTPEWQTMALAGFYSGKILLSEWGTHERS